MKPFVALSLAAALSGCSLDNQYADAQDTVNDVADEQVIDKVRLNDLALEQVWADPWVTSIAWTLEADVPQYEWTLLLDDTPVANGNQTVSATNVSLAKLSEGYHILKLKVCASTDQCVFSQPILVNLVKDTTNNNTGENNSGDNNTDGSNTGGSNTGGSNGDNNTDDKNTGSTGDGSIDESLSAIVQKYFGNDSPDDYLANDRLAFYDVDRHGNTRAIRNDLSGTLQGMVQFVQSHSVNPNNNDSQNHPDVVAQRQAMLLFTPANETAGGYTVTARLNGEELGRLELNHPNLLPKSDYANTDGRSDVVYSKRAFHGVLPWNWMNPGLSLTFSDDVTSGTLAAQNIEFGAPAELVLHNIRLGLLTDPPRSENHKLITEAVKYTTDYFQTIPVSKLVNAHYQEMKLDKVIIASGKIYDQISDDNGDVYSGDMRQNVAKEQISTGINEANWGRSSTANRESNPQLTARITMHHAQGYYQNGVQAHGLSGGAGIGTLYSSHGNELSHELGHNYGLGHYPGRNGNDVYWAAHHADSGWGYIAHRNRMRANLHWNADNTGITVVDSIKSNEVFANTYSYNKDAMSGGSVVSAYSAYTHHTGYSANKIQHWMQPKWIADTQFSSGFKKWQDNQFVEANTAGQYRVPKKVGVPVVTLLGGYDPNVGQQKAVLYPAFVSNYGNVYDLAQANISTNECGMDVRFGNGQTDKIALHGSRVQSGYINKFHINLEAARQPQSATLYCHQNGVKNVLASVSLPAQLPELQAAVIVGEEYGFEQLKQQEISQLNDYILQFDSAQDMVFDHATQAIVDAWPNTQGLSPSAQMMLDEYKLINQKIDVLSAWVKKESTPAASTLTSLMSDLALLPVSFPAGGTIRSDRYNGCLTLQADNRVSVETGACSAITQRWFMDRLGKIHSVAKPGMCLLTSSSGSTVQTCENQAQFMWQQDDQRRYQVGTETGKCLDYTSAGSAIMYSCHGNENQKWTIESMNEDATLSRLPGSVLQHLP